MYFKTLQYLVLFINLRLSIGEFVNDEPVRMKQNKILNRPAPTRPPYQNNNQNFNNKNGDYHTSWVQGSEAQPVKQPHPSISDVDMQLLAAMEKIVARLDKLDSRVTRLENMVLAFNPNKIIKDKNYEKGSCPGNFTKIDGIKGKCFYASSLSSAGGRPQNLYDWKTATTECNRLGGRLAEILSYGEFHRISNFLSQFSSARTQVTPDLWTGGLNPGLIWIWAESGQQVEQDRRFWNENDNSSSAPGCLKLAHSVRFSSFYFKSAPCSQSLNFLCEVIDNNVARALALFEEELFTQNNTSSVVDDL